MHLPQTVSSASQPCTDIDMYTASNNPHSLLLKTSNDDEDDHTFRSSIIIIDIDLPFHYIGPMASSMKNRWVPQTTSGANKVMTVTTPVTSITGQRENQNCYAVWVQRYQKCHTHFLVF